MDTNECGFKCGRLPECAPLAVSFVPEQQSSTPAYPSDQALSRGTLFPGLDLPFMNVVNTTKKLSTPMLEVMAVDFVTDELRLYLDTHKNDAEAFAAYQGFLKLSKEAHKRYTEFYGPISQSDMLHAKGFTWVNNPWPWDYAEGNGDC